jgi:hypothetical protein
MYFGLYKIVIHIPQHVTKSVLNRFLGTGNTNVINIYGSRQTPPYAGVERRIRTVAKWASDADSPSA